MKTLPSLLILAAAAGLLAGCGKKTETPPTATNATGRYDSGNPMTAPADYVGAVVQAKKYSEKQIDLAYVNQAIQQFQAGEGRLPKSLDELVEEHYLGKVPDAPFGYQINYDPATGIVKVVKK